MIFSTDSSRMYAALRCIEAELENKKPSIKVIRKIIAEAGRELRPTKRAGGRLTERGNCGNSSFSI